MADVRFYQEQQLFDAEPLQRWARLIVYEDDYSNCLDSVSPFLFQFTNINLFFGERKIPVGISEYDEASNYDTHKEIIDQLLLHELQKVDVVFYTTSERIKEAYYNDFEEAMHLNIKTTNDKEIMYWSYCGKNDCALLVAFENLSDYKECLEYLQENFH